MNEHIKAGIEQARSALSHRAIRRYGGFLLGGALAFITDAALLVALTRVLGLSPFAARPMSISVAMVVSWLVNRTITFAETMPPSLTEFGRFAAVAWSAQVINYSIFALLLLTVPGLDPVLALALACVVSMFFSFNGYRLGVFNRQKR